MKNTTVVGAAASGVFSFPVDVIKNAGEDAACSSLNVIIYVGQTIVGLDEEEQ